MRNLRVAGSFLTRVPLHVEGTVEVASATPWFPVVGALVGAAGAAVFAAMSELVPSGTAAALALVVTALITGAFHHDGLGDIADAFGGGWTVEQRLSILKDSRHGTYAVVSIVLAVLVQFSALGSLPSAWGAAGVIAANTLGRSAILGILVFGTPAGRPGLGTDYAAGLDRRRVGVGLVAGIAIGAVAIGPWIVVAVAALVGSSLAVHTIARRKIGGFSGDVLGATELVGECVVLVVVAAAHHRGHTLWLAEM